jgi:glycerol-3-phosphate acyltransferase PlsY
VSPEAAWLIGAGVVGYLLGSIPFGLIVGKRRGVDPRTTGSGNIGATNVARSLGKRVGAIVLVLDALKGALPTAIARFGGLEAHGGPWLVPVIGAAAVAGHCFPVWLKLRGGKGVATALGIFVVLDPLATALALAVFLAVYLPFRIVSIGSMIGALSYPAWLLVFGRPPAWVDLALVVSLLIIVRHRANIRRLIAQTELKGPTEHRRRAARTSGPPSA